MMNSHDRAITKKLCTKETGFVHVEYNLSES